MGMHDDVRSKYPLPLPEYQDLVFQTKDVCPDPYTTGRDDEITISEDGRFLRSEWDWHTNERKAPAFEPFSGDVHFYTFPIWEKEPQGWVEFRAKFQEGVLSPPIEIIEHRLENLR